MNFLNALEKISGLIEKYENENKCLSKDLPILKEVMTATWKKEPELKDLKSELSSLDRKIQLTLSSKDLNKESQEENIKVGNTISNTQIDVTSHRGMRI